MSGNTAYRVANTSLLSIAAEEAPVVVTSAEMDDAVAGTLKRLRLARGLVQRVAGVKERRWWADGTSLAEGAAMAGSKAMSEAGVDPASIGVVINTSVSRDYLEPAVSVDVHHLLGLPTSTMNFDITNACLGFVNGMQVAASMIDSGQVEYALIVASEDVRATQRATLDRLRDGDITRAEYLNEFATLTLGSGAAAAVLGRSDDHPGGHRLVGGVARSGTEHHDLCHAVQGKMTTDTAGMLEAGVSLIADAWDEAKEDWRWTTGVARYVLHQVSVPHTTALLGRLGLDALDKVRVPMTLPSLGNVAAAALPITLAQQVSSLVPGDRVLCMGVGSGLNTSLCEIVW